MNILVTGGAGYIGSHTTVELLIAGHKVIIADNLYNAHYTAVSNIAKITVRPLRSTRSTVHAGISFAMYLQNRRSMQFCMLQTTKQWAKVSRSRWRTTAITWTAP